MTRTVRYLTHPQVLIDPATPIPDWSLSAAGAGYASGDSADAIRQVLAACPEKQRCALYAVDDAVVWQADPKQRAQEAVPQP